MSAVKAASSSGVFRCRLCVARGCPTTEHARRSETSRCERTCSTHARSGKGLVFSLESFLQDQFIQRQLGDRPLQAVVLAIEILQTFGLVELQTAVLAPPAIVALL